MSFKHFTKDNLNTYLKALGKEFRKLNGKVTPAEIILIGGAAVLANYGFREITLDIDAIIQASSAMKDAINHVADKYELPNGWINTDFIRTPSYSPKLVEISKYYKTFSNILQIRTVSAEYLIAMKLRSFRDYKYDRSDVLGILGEHDRRGQPITLECIDAAVETLYGGWESMPEEAKEFIEDSLALGNYYKMFHSARKEEVNMKNLLLEEKQADYISNGASAKDFLKAVKARKANSE